MMLSSIPISSAKVAGDVAANGIIVTSWIGLLTPVSTIIAFIYLCVRLYETKTFKQVMKFIASKF